MSAEEASSAEPWRRRLFVPNYQVSEAARYAGVSPRTVVEWHKDGERKTLSARDRRAALSYLQLIEVAVVSALRRAGVSLSKIKAAREYVAKQLMSEYPFAEYRFKTDGKALFMDYAQVEEGKANTLLRPDKGGQLAWEGVIGRLQEFEYEHRGLAVRWRVAGLDSPVIIDPQIAFGAPTIRGTPTWVLRGRWEAGETISDMSTDFGLRDDEVVCALEFEGVNPAAK